MLRSCAGIVVRYYLGFVLGYTSIINSHIPTAFAAEALACYHAFCLGIDSGLQEAIFEGDSLIVIQKINSPIHDESVIGPYIRDIKALVRCFCYCHFMHVSHGGNSVAHTSRGGGRSFERSGVPDFALQVVERDRHVAFARESASFVGPFAA
ncbi:hypothetical protein PVK06_027097 [Gossypium arboreum]|uniref:RNase H type-1 domain-containing protein n=1 Tax=Gossypium arboreum TaxID=29729 RepID=A0ABR0P2B8_GOSAR|nr:hypothetical protein PVK06_027097 [Gossypium arboreum]